MIPLITLEEHFTSNAFLTSPKNAQLFNSFPPGPVRDALTDLSDLRIRSLDAGGVSKQVISHGAGTGNPEQCRNANDQLKAAIDAHPDRFAGFAALSIAEAGEAVKELKRCVQELGFVGTLVENHLDEDDAEIFFDAERFWPIFEAAQELDAVVYIHPTPPTPAMQERLYKGNYPAIPVQGTLGHYGFGWHSMTGLNFLRMYASGVFDRFPRLKIILGHMGELLPFQLDRILRQDGKGAFGKHERSLKAVWTENVWVTTSGMFSLAPLACLLATTTKDRVLYSVDYPFSSNETGKEFMEVVEKSGLFSKSEFEDFGYRNAARLLKLDMGK
ncbi:MAG: hypothetical protein Q9160_001587 [Pyrenula sp. 1 TL-2023]